MKRRPPPAPDAPRRPPWLLLVPLLLAAAAYARVLPGEFMFDDSRAIERNLALKDLGGYLGAHFLPDLLHGGRPVADLLFALDYAVGRLDPLPFHASGIAVHLLATVLAFLLVRELLRLAGAARAEGVALAAAGLFALHPMQTQAVSYLIQLAETLSSAGYLGTLLLLLRAERRGWNRAGAGWAALAWLAYLLALGAKTIAVTLPVAWLLLAAVVPGAAGRDRLLRWRQRLLLAVPFVALDALFAASTLAGIEGHTDAGFSVPGITPWTYLLSQSRVIVTYLRLLLWPSGQNVDWDFPAARSLAEPSVLLASALQLLLLGAAAWVGIRARGREGPDAAAARAGAFGVLWFFLLLSPTSSVVPLADLVMEHRVYLASLGLFAATALGVERLLARVPGDRARRAAPALAGAAWLALAGATWHRNAVWETRLALWGDAAANSPHKARVHLGLGYALRERGRYGEAIAEYHRGLADVGGNADLEVQLLRNLGSALIYSQRLDEADAVLRRAAAIDPRSVDVLVNLGVVAQRRGDMAGAEAWARQVIALQPGQGDALQLLGIAALQRGDYAGGAALLERAVRADPDEGVRLVNLGVAYEQLGRPADACAAWREALRRRLDAAQRARTASRLAARGCGPPP